MALDGNLVLFWGGTILGAHCLSCHRQQQDFMAQKVNKHHHRFESPDYRVTICTLQTLGTNVIFLNPSVGLPAGHTA